MVTKIPKITEIYKLIGRKVPFLTTFRPVVVYKAGEKLSFGPLFARFLLVRLAHPD